MVGSCGSAEMDGSIRRPKAADSSKGEGVAARIDTQNPHCALAQSNAETDASQSRPCSSILTGVWTTLASPVSRASHLPPPSGKRRMTRRTFPQCGLERRPDSFAKQRGPTVRDPSGATLDSLEIFIVHPELYRMHASCIMSEASKPYPAAGTEAARGCDGCCKRSVLRC